MTKNQKLKTIFCISEVASQRGIGNPHQLHLRTGISVPRASKLWRGVGKFALTDINLFCDALDCDIQDLIKRVRAAPDAD